MGRGAEAVEAESLRVSHADDAEQAAVAVGVDARGQVEHLADCQPRGRRLVMRQVTDELVHEGKVVYFGASNYAGWQLLKALGIASLGSLVAAVLRYEE